MRASLRRGQTAAMSPDDRLADPEPHAHAIRLRREEGVENAIGRSRVEARASVFDGDEHARRFDGLRCYRHAATTPGHQVTFGASVSGGKNPVPNLIGRLAEDPPAWQRPARSWCQLAF